MRSRRERPTYDLTYHLRYGGQSQYTDVPGSTYQHGHVARPAHVIHVARLLRLGSLNLLCPPPQPTTSVEPTTRACIPSSPSSEYTDPLAKSMELDFRAEGGGGCHRRRPWAKRASIRNHPARGRLLLCVNRSTFYEGAVSGLE